MNYPVGSVETISICDWLVTDRIEIQGLNTKDGDFLHLLGPNGSGKSSLLDSS